MTNGMKIGGIVGGVLILVSIIAASDSPSPSTSPAQVITPTAEEQTQPKTEKVEKIETTVTETEAPAEIPVTTSSESPVAVEESATYTPPEVFVPEPTPEPVREEPKSASNCHPEYSGCLKASASDYDCAGGSGNGPYYTGPVQVYGSDPFGLDRDNDGWGCE